MPRGPTGEVAQKARGKGGWGRRLRGRINQRGSIPGPRSRTSQGSFWARTEDKVLYFRADKDLPYGKIQDAVEMARKAGVRVMAAITDVKPSGKGLFEK